ncbi:MAG: hypothetical protein OEM91_02895 [Hyphomicrobiales bacterium]|nr:hypothetical protein [Hyphomicrobiales bacterium]
MYRALTKTFLTCVLGAGIALTGGCSVTESIPYPKLSSVKKIKQKLLSKDEQDAAIRDMSLEQQSHRKAAEREIEKR